MYVEDITEKVIQCGVVRVQHRILKDLCVNESVDIEDKSKGRIILEGRLCRKRILMVLDDVRDNHKMLTEGSLCIISSRRRRVFQKSNYFDINHETYIPGVQLLSDVDSKRVFSSYAFGDDCKVKPGLEEMVGNISKGCGGAPLVLKVYGTLLRTRRIWAFGKK